MSEAIVDILTYHNYQVDAVYDGADALAYAQVEQYDGIILDVMMPQKNGFEVLEQLRREGHRTPVYMGELLARIRAMLRRREEYKPDILTFGDISLNPHSSELSAVSRSLVLSKLEYRLMETLMLHQGIYLSSEDILTKVWGYETDAELGSVWVYISYLRKRLQELNAKTIIQAKRNTGYRLEVGA